MLKHVCKEGAGKIDRKTFLGNVNKPSFQRRPRLVTFVAKDFYKAHGNPQSLDRRPNFPVPRLQREDECAQGVHWQDFFVPAL